ncbi:MAG: hypothetical protein DMD60_13990 [Gemmatimonadetes bacterium]|nr:MAG: hypothetical protein DMD60_13990 [Gemmatimonadota bacterium]
MTPLASLWLPILLAAVGVFLASSVLHMFTGWHKSDYLKVPNEDRVMDTLRPLAIPPGDYMMPRPGSTEEMRSPAFVEKFKKGPVMMFTVMPGGSMAMGKNLAQWFVFSVVVGIFAGYVAAHALPPGAGPRGIVRMVGVTAFLGYTLALWPMSIWYRRSWITTIKGTVDGLVYALLTAGVFAWLWPH